MYVEKVYSGGDGFTAVKFGGIVATNVREENGPSNLFRHGLRLSERTQEYLPDGGYFAHLPRELGTIVCRVSSEAYELEPWHFLDAMHRALCATYGGQNLELKDSDGQRMVWGPLVDIGGTDFVGEPQFVPVEDGELFSVAA
jgi:hypothetical protein